MSSTTLRSDGSVWRLTPEGWRLVWAQPGSPLVASKAGPQTSRLEGADFSHWNDQGQFAKVLQSVQWVALKATQGTSYVDTTFRSRWAQLGGRIQAAATTLRIAYHFLTPGSGAAQAKFFLRTVGIAGSPPAGSRLALDWEAGALSYPTVLRDAAETVHQLTGLYPLIYASASQIARVRSVVPAAPLWVAKWSAPTPTDVPFVQYAEGPGYDHDYFNGDLTALRCFAGFDGADPPVPGAPVLGFGSRGDDVQAAQQRLVEWLRAGGRLTEAQVAAQRFDAAYQSNGGHAYFGAATQALVMDYQRAHSVRRPDGRMVPLTPDGVVGPDTWAAMDAESPASSR